MPRIFLRSAGLFAFVLAFGGCRDQMPEPLAPGAFSPTHLPSPELNETIKALILEVFPAGIGQATTSHWKNVVKKLEDGDAAGARSQLLTAVSFVQTHTDDILPPTGETQEEVAIRLINLMVTYAFRGSVIGSDAVVAIVNPDEKTVVSTPDGRAAIELPAGALSQPTVLVVYRDPVQNRAACAGPLATTLCQYPLFYHFDPYPRQRLNVAARVGVCHVNSGPGAPPEDADERLRLAHDRPADPAGYVPGSTIREGIEILPLEGVSDFLFCGTTTLASAVSAAPAGNSLADRGLRTLGRLASAAVALVSPTTAHAIDQGGGGLVLDFSNFVVVDPGEDGQGDGVAADVTPPIVTYDVVGDLGDGGWYTSDVTVSWLVSDGESAIVSAPCTDASLTNDTAGETFTCTATSAGGTTTVPVSVKRDATDPVIGYAGNAGTYTVDQSVAITCSASDAMSDLVSNSCQDNISGEAYTFGLGAHSYSATASDEAGNSNTATTSFKVIVTPASLCTLTRRFSSSAGIGNSLCAKLGAYAASIARGSSVSAAGQLSAYKKEVQAQSGKAITSANASILITLANAL